MSHACRTAGSLDFSDQDVLFEVHRRRQPGNGSLAATVGLAFRLPTMSMILAADPGWPAGCLTAWADARG